MTIHVKQTDLTAGTVVNGTAVLELDRRPAPAPHVSMAFRWLVRQPDAQQLPQTAAPSLLGVAMLDVPPDLTVDIFSGQAQVVVPAVVQAGIGIVASPGYPITLSSNLQVVTVMEEVPGVECRGRVSWYHEGAGLVLLIPPPYTERLRINSTVANDLFNVVVLESFSPRIYAAYEDVPVDTAMTISGGFVAVLNAPAFGSFVWEWGSHGR